MYFLIYTLSKVDNKTYTYIKFYLLNKYFMVNKFIRLKAECILDGYRL